MNKHNINQKSKMNCSVQNDAGLIQSDAKQRAFEIKKRKLDEAWNRQKATARKRRNIDKLKSIHARLKNASAD